MKILYCTDRGETLVGENVDKTLPLKVVRFGRLSPEFNASSIAEICSFVLHSEARRC
jgi:hypothetical protein